MMRTELQEGIVLGVAIGLAALAIRAWADGSTFWQGVLLLLVGLVLSGVQLWFSFRRGRANELTSTDTTRSGSYASNPFAQELTRNWTGLNDQAIEPTSLETPNRDEQDDSIASQNSSRL